MRDKDTEGARAGQSHRRGEVVDDAILDATCEELARVGYAALSLSQVAARADVHRTTVYRRWPTKVELVTAAMERADRRSALGPSTRSLRGDLKLLIRSALESLGAAGMVRILQNGLGGEDAAQLQAAAVAAEARKHSVALNYLETAVARGELRADVDLEMFLDGMLGVLFARLVLKGERLDEPAVDVLVEHLVTMGAPR